MIAAHPPVEVCATCAVTTLQQALAAARPGARIVVRGVQRGNFVVRVANATIEGAPGAALDGGGRGTVLWLAAPGATVRGLGIRNGGSDFVAMDAGVRIAAAGATLDRVTIENTLFGAYVQHADRTTIERSRIEGRSGVPLPERGDGVRVWYSNGVRVAGNRIVGARDDLIWFSDGANIVDNVITGGRYGIHTMYSNDMLVAGNAIQDCEVGSYAMYGKNLRVERNLFSNNRGSTGYGIGLKSVDDSTIADNAFVANHSGVYADNAPSAEGAVIRFTGNLFAYNEAGFSALPSSRGDVLLGNAFVQNYRQVAVLGGVVLSQLTWSKGGSGNYWSDYAGYDRNGDGIGDVPYLERSAFGTLADLDPRLELLAYSPAAAAVDFAARALPLFAQPPTMADAAPQMRAHYPQGLPVAPRDRFRSAYAPLGVAALLLAFGMLVPLRRHAAWDRTPDPGGQRGLETRDGALAVRLRGVRKRYGAATALDGVDLDVARGETVVLWGPNGSGKTTLLRCVLRVVRFEGSVDAPRSPGYVPQQLPPFDMSLDDLTGFVAALRGASSAEARAALHGVGLFAMRGRNVMQLSDGQRRRLAMALAAIGDPPALLLDEPTVGLDLASRDAILRSLREFKRRGKTMIVATHVSGDVAAVADRVAMMEEGRIVAMLSPSEFAATVAARAEAVS